MKTGKEVEGVETSYPEPPSSLQLVPMTLEMGSGDRPLYKNDHSLVSSTKLTTSCRGSIKRATTQGSSHPMNLTVEAEKTVSAS